MQHKEALADAEECIKLDPTFSKGYSRKAFSLFSQGLCVIFSTSPLGISRISRIFRHFFLLSPHCGTTSHFPAHFRSPVSLSFAPCFCRYTEAILTCETGLKIDPENASLK